MRPIPAATALANLASTHPGCCSHGKTVWQGTKTPFLATCERVPEHGDFETTYDRHYRHGQHCPECAGNRPVFEAEALRRCIAKHTDATTGEPLYDYTDWGYQNPNAKARITCKVEGHPPFWQRPERHWRGDGCPECGGVGKWGTARVIVEATRVHGVGVIDFSETEYVNSRTKFVLICALNPRHGRFEKSTDQLIRQKQGCPTCALARRAALRRKPSELFVSESNEVHAYFYAYERMGEYVNNRTKVTITCPEHGDFEQAPDSHLAGKGCPRCKSSTGEKAVRQALIKHGVAFDEEWRGHDLRDKRPLAFDFIIPDQRILIEFDGIQHREPRTWKTGDTMEAAVARFADIQRRDAMKDEWAVENGWRLIRLEDVETVEADLIAAGVLNDHDQTQAA